MELKVLIAAIAELESTRESTSATVSSLTAEIETAREAAGEREVEALEGVRSRLVGLLPGVLATVILRTTLYS